MNYLYLYILLINIITFGVFALDKKKAKKKQWRIPESTLLLLSLIGGSLGGLLAMKIVKHKTQKIKFVIGVPFLLIVNFLMYFYITKGW